MSITGWNRAAVVQSAKAALAAVLAWLAAAWLFRLPQPFLTPWGDGMLMPAQHTLRELTAPYAQ